MADVELLPLPEWAKRDDLGGLVPSEVRAAMHAYARANVAHATAPLQAEIEALRAEVDVLKADNARLREALLAIVDEVSDGLVPYSSDSYLPAHLVEQVRAALA